jgi:hypothetical protein
MGTVSGIRDGKKSDPGWETFGSGILDKHPGSATMIFAFLFNYSVSAKAWECWPTAR